MGLLLDSRRCHLASQNPLFGFLFRGLSLSFSFSFSVSVRLPFPVLFNNAQAMGLSLTLSLIRLSGCCQMFQFFCLGSGNPSGINNKLYTLDSFPVGWWHFAETQSSQHQQHVFQGYVRQLAWRSNRHLRSCVGAPAPVRVGSQVAGSWTGVASFGDCPLRKVPCVWPADEYSSGRVMITVGQLGTQQLTVATVYCPAKGPTYPNATALAERLLEPITENLTFGRQGPRAIVGDFNCVAGSLQQMKLWQSQGWIELQDLMHQRHGLVPRATCKGKTAPDQVWLSPECIPLVTNISFWQIYPDHDLIIAGLSIPSQSEHTYQWSLPGHIPWKMIDQVQWESTIDIGPFELSSSRHEGCHRLFPDDSEGYESGQLIDTTRAFSTWSRSFEHKVSECLSSAVSRTDRSFFGRGQITRPKLRRNQPQVPKHSRPGEVEQTCGFLNRAIARWFKQLRRLQSYRHAAHAVRCSDTFHSRAALWNSILRATGFQPDFAAWWPTPKPGIADAATCASSRCDSHGPDLR